MEQKHSADMQSHFEEVVHRKNYEEGSETREALMSLTKRVQAKDVEIGELTQNLSEVSQELQTLRNQHSCVSDRKDQQIAKLNSELQNLKATHGSKEKEHAETTEMNLQQLAETKALLEKAQHEHSVEVSQLQNQLHEV